MPELQMDVAVANRFISSLSKSLQALCHGCMDFDSGIEIVGYINVNIDSGSKVDYVLNEKVLKSTTNSMTFVSNSFLARKEQPKQTRDGACSPIPEVTQQPAVMSPFQNRARGYFHGLHTRSAAPVSHSYVQRGAQKRSWTAMERDWRMSPKKQREATHSYSSPNESSSLTQDGHTSSLSSSSHSVAEADFKLPWVQSSDTDSASVNPEVNIKKELVENDSVKATDQDEQDQSHQDSSDNTDEKTRLSKVKSEPDTSVAATDEDSSATSVNTAKDYKGTFLEPSSTSEENQHTSEQNRNEINASDNCQAEEDVGSLPQPEDFSEDVPSENVAEGSERPVEYDEAAEDGAYPHSVYSDAGEGSSDAGQFEVIEIEDEDEDVQAMFGEPQEHYQQMRKSTHHLSQQLTFSKNVMGMRDNPHPYVNSLHQYRGNFRQQSSNSLSARLPVPIPTMPHTLACQYCSTQFTSKSLLNRHMTDQHPQLPMSFPYNCAECGKGFFSQSGRNHHMESHLVKSQCSVCGHTFKYSRNLKRHLEFNHHMKECRQCRSYVSGEEFRTHVLQCTGQNTNMGK